MAGLADPIRLREFTNAHPQFPVEDVHPGKAPLTGKTLQGLYVGEVGRRHPADPYQISYKPRFDQSIPESLELPYVPTRPFDYHETTYNRAFTSTFVPQDLKYTPTSHFGSLPIEAKSPPYLPAVNHPSWP